LLLGKPAGDQRKMGRVAGSLHFEKLSEMTDVAVDTRIPKLLVYTSALPFSLPPSPLRGVLLVAIPV